MAVDDEDERPGGHEAVPGLAPPPPAGRVLLEVEVDGRRFRVSERRTTGRAHTYDYDWLDSPAGYGFARSGPAVDDDEQEHVAAVRAFLADVDPATGRLRDE